ncbi:AAA family ATPase [Xanthobacter autotrophicus]|uniref:AAA family ATPase n=1 Tax=Xanthobacter TaxID=279 RepID=UPI0024AC2562|nr:AAA family ATPase [Xanthobacter autotrophicus]MDI4664684.1 AAA family ATPase [Xanthobacter autotrophicus]
MNIAVGETLTLEEIEAIRAEVRIIMAEEGLTQADISKETGIAYGTFTAWNAGTYKGDNSGFAIKVRRWLETRRERKRTHSVLPKAPSFVATPTAQTVMEIMAFAQAAPDLGVVVGGAGIGKTTAIEEYQRQHSNVYVVTAEPCLSSPNNMLSAIADELGVIERRNTYVSRAIVARLKGASALLVVDEAQHLSSQALDQLRTIHDKARCGVIVSGNESVFARLQGGETKGAQFAQLHSRVGMRIVQATPRARDICALVAAWGIDAASPEANLLKLIARKPGALRGLTKALRIANMLAAGSGEALSARHIRQAWSQLSSSSLDTAA